ncbi:sugar transferase [Actinoplanes sp. NPDC051513]|uniref:sugar transferase n=1 Tax=Actinoplanes sp. NPDC051513 TaxID=3363908 RepID=UPI00378F8D3F
MILKRLTDLVLGSLLLIPAGPLMLAIGLLILLFDGSPVFFVQMRPGLHGQPFGCRKFRTMRPPAPGQDMWTSDAERMTKLGTFLRRTSLDELPELFHVLSGKMSLVGPRPLLMEYLPQYNEVHRRRHDVRPGITGLAQINGRRSLTLSQRLDLDVEYVRTRNLRMDLGILVRTLFAPFRPGDVAGQTLDDIDDLGFHSARKADDGDR